MSIRIPDELTKIGFTEDQHPAGITAPGVTPFSWCAIFTIADNRSGLSGNRLIAALDGMFNLQHNATTQRIRIAFEGASQPTDLFTTNLQSGGNTLEDTLIYAAGNFGFGGVANLFTRGVGIAPAQNSQSLGAWAPDTVAVNRLRIGGSGATSALRTQTGDYILFFLRSTEITFTEFSNWDLSDIFGLWTAGVTWATLHATPTGPEDGGGGASGDGALIGDPVLARRLCVYRPDADPSLIRNAAIPDFNNPASSAVFIDPYEEHAATFARTVSALPNALPDPPILARVSPLMRAVALAMTAAQVGFATAVRILVPANSRGSKGAAESLGRDGDQNFASGSAGAASMLPKVVGSFGLPMNPSGTRRMPGFPGDVARYSSGGAKFTDAATGGSLKRSFPLSTLATDGHLCEGWLLRAGDVIENLYWIEPGSGMEAGDTLRCEALVIEYPAATPDEVRIYGVESATRGVQGSELMGIEDTLELGTAPTLSYTALAGDTKSTTALTTTSDLSPIVGETDLGVRVIRAANGSHHCAQVASATFDGVNYAVTLRDALPNAIATGDVLHFGPVTARLLTLEIPAADRSETYFGMGISCVAGLAAGVSHGGVSVKPGVAFAPAGQGGTGYVEQGTVDFPGLIGKCMTALDVDVVLFCPAQQQADPDDTELFLAELTSDGADFERAFNPAWQHQSDIFADWQDYGFSQGDFAGDGANENLLAVVASPYAVMGGELPQLIAGDASDDGTHPSFRGMKRGMNEYWIRIAAAALAELGAGGGRPMPTVMMYAATQLLARRTRR